jgi:hypothetical protein
VPNRADAALVRLNPDVPTIGNTIPNLSGCPFAGMKLAQEAIDRESLDFNMSVGKIGRTTGYTQGTITALSMRNLAVQSTDGTFIFDDLIEIAGDEPDHFSSAGDTGALVFTIPDLTPIGLVVAGTLSSAGERLTYVCWLDQILSLFKIELME